MKDLLFKKEKNIYNIQRHFVGMNENELDEDGFYKVKK